MSGVQSFWNRMSELEFGKEPGRTKGKDGQISERPPNVSTIWKNYFHHLFINLIISAWTKLTLLHFHFHISLALSRYPYDMDHITILYGPYIHSSSVTLCKCFCKWTGKTSSLCDKEIKLYLQPQRFLNMVRSVFNVYQG